MTQPTTPFARPTLRRLRAPVRRSAMALAAWAVLGGAATAPTQAATCTWAPATGNWNVTANWSCGAVPGAADTASVASGQTASTVNAFFAPTTSLANAGTVNIVNNSGLSLQGSNTNSGLINLQSVGNFTQIVINGLTSLNGAGTVSLSNNGVNRILASGADTLTIGAGQTIRGSGQMGAGTALSLVNGGTIMATQSNDLVVSTTGSVTTTA